MEIEGVLPLSETVVALDDSGDVWPEIAVYLEDDGRV
jgi:hypothetical protein